MDSVHIKSLPKIPGVGPSILQDLLDLKITSLENLKLQNPETMYHRLCDLRGTKIDKCVLYTFRCAVYFAQNKKHDPEKLKWWNWKDISN
jgi:hypothetical protein